MRRKSFLPTSLSFVHAVLVAAALHVAGLIALKDFVGRSRVPAVPWMEHPIEEMVLEIDLDSTLREVAPGPSGDAYSQGPTVLGAEPSARVGLGVGTSRSPEPRALVLRNGSRRLPAEPPEAAKPEPTDSEDAPGSDANGQSSSKPATTAPGAVPHGGALSGVDLGLGPAAWTKWMPFAAASGTPVSVASPGAEKSRGYSTTGGLREALEARDQELGLGPGGTVLTAAGAAAHSEVAPQLGRASFSESVRRKGYAA